MFYPVHHYCHFYHEKIISRVTKNVYGGGGVKTLELFNKKTKHKMLNHTDYKILFFWKQNN